MMIRHICESSFDIQRMVVGLGLYGTEQVPIIALPRGVNLFSGGDVGVTRNPERRMEDTRSPTGICVCTVCVCMYLIGVMMVMSLPGRRMEGNLLC